MPIFARSAWAQLSLIPNATLEGVSVESSFNEPTKFPMMDKHNHLRMNFSDLPAL